jgi:hypothetical protein
VNVVEANVDDEGAVAIKVPSENNIPDSVEVLAICILPVIVDLPLTARTLPVPTVLVPIPTFPLIIAPFAIGKILELNAYEPTTRFAET